MTTKDTSPFQTTLRKHGYSVTKPRQAVYSALSEADAMSMGQLVKILQAKVDRTSVYRTVDLFERIGIVNRIHIGWKYKLELSEQFSHHHHHAACTSCGEVLVFSEDPKLEKEIHTLAESLGLLLEGHTLELRGKCRSCSISEHVANDFNRH